MHAQLKRIQSFYSTNKLSAIEKNYITGKGFFRSGKNIFCYKCRKSHGIGPNNMDEVDNHVCDAIVNIIPSVPIPSPYTATGLYNAKNDLNFEEFRYATFSNWTTRSILETEPPELASAGFYFANSRNTLKCFYCKTILNPMISPNHTISEHKNNQICRGKKFSLQLQKKNVKGSKTLAEQSLENRPLCKSPDQADNSTIYILLMMVTFGMDVTSDNAAEFFKAYMAQKKIARNKVIGRELECKICMDGKVDMIFKPCHHAVACTECSEKVTACPFCNTTIVERNKIYF